MWRDAFLFGIATAYNTCKTLSDIDVALGYSVDETNHLLTNSTSNITILQVVAYQMFHIRLIILNLNTKHAKFLEESNEVRKQQHNPYLHCKQDLERVFFSCDSFLHFINYQCMYIAEDITRLGVQP